MHRFIVLLGASAALAACGQQADAPANTTAATATAPEKKHPTYCFFKDADTKGFTATRAAHGGVLVKGRVHIADRRYMGALGDADVKGAAAKLWLTMAPNTTGSGAPGDWWDVSASVPNGAAIATVAVMCGKKTVAELTLKKA